MKQLNGRHRGGKSLTQRIKESELFTSGALWTPTDMAKSIGLEHQGIISSTLANMLADGVLVRPRIGEYRNPNVVHWINRQRLANSGKRAIAERVWVNA